MVILTAIVCTLITLGLGVACFASVASAEQIMSVTNFIVRYSVKCVVTSASYEADGLHITWEARGRWIGECALAVWTWIVVGAP